MDKSSLSGRHAAITGGTQGLGEAVARLFAERDAAGLVICGRNVARGEAVAAELTEGGCPTEFVAADLAQVADCRRVIARADERFGSLHALVNCAAVTERGNVLTTTEELFDRMFAVNVRAPFFLMQEAVRLMLRDGIEGTIVNIASVVSRGGSSFLAPYTASKGALATLTRNVAFSLLRNRIRVNGLNIGWMDTPGEDVIQKTFHDATDSWLAEAEARQPFGRLLKPEEVARAVAYLSSDESGLMTGSMVDFDQSVAGAWDAATLPNAPVSLA